MGMTGRTSGGRVRKKYYQENWKKSMRSLSNVQQYFITIFKNHLKLSSSGRSGILGAVEASG